jgi:hypothetical protein
MDEYYAPPMMSDDISKPPQTLDQPTGERKRPRPNVWGALGWAGVLSIVLGILFFSFQTEGGPVFFVFILYMFAATAICEALGFGKFNLLGGTTIPDWALMAVMGVLLYLSCLILVLIVRWILRLSRTRTRSSTI